MSSRLSTSAPDLVSVILCTHNGERTLADQLAALARQDYTGNWELVIVNDGSTDASVSIAESWSGRLPMRIVHTAEPGSPVGLASARNVGGNEARGDVLLFCDDDDVADEAWISAFADAACESAALGGFNEEETLNDPIVRYWRFPLTPGRLPIAFGKAHTPLGNNCGAWSTAFHEVGGFDPAYSQFSSGEEFDFFLRVQLAGYPLTYVPEAIMHIRHRNSLKSLVRQWYGYGLSNALLYTRFRDDLGVRGTTARETLGVLVRVARGIPKALATRRHRGAWLRMTSFAYGQVVGSIRNRVWHVG